MQTVPWLYHVYIWGKSKGQNLERLISIWPRAQFQGHKPRTSNQKTLVLYFILVMSYITIRMILDIKRWKTRVKCLRTLSTKIYVLLHVVTNNFMKIFCQYLIWFLKIRDNKPKSKFWSWPWPLTLTSFFKLGPQDTK